MLELVGSGMRIDSLVEALENYLNIFYHLCAIDPLVVKQLLAYIKSVRQLLKGETDSNPVLKRMYEQYGEATQDMERKEAEAQEKEKR